MTREEFRARARRGLLLDGANGSNLMAAGMPRGVSTEDWVLEHPDVFQTLQRCFAAAGSELVYAPTFTGNRVYRKGPVAELNRRLVAVSRAAVGALPVAGDVTTVGRPDLPYEEMLDIYGEQIGALCEAGVDAIVIETMMGQQECLAALEVARSCCELPVLCSFSVSADGMLYFGGSVLETARDLEALGADAVGVNCSCGPDQLVSVVRNLRDAVSLPIIAKPNAGMPVIDEKTGQAVYPMGPEAFARSMRALMEAGATVVGGCCGTTPEHIAALRQVKEEVLG